MFGFVPGIFDAPIRELVAAPKDVPHWERRPFALSDPAHYTAPYPWKPQPFRESAGEKKEMK